MNKNLSLFLTFLKIGAFTFGGGYAMIPLIKAEIADKKGWISEADITDMLAISESTPGPIAVNTATFVGFKVGGTLGAFCATAGVVIPSFVIISVLSLYIEAFEHAPVVKYAFWGIRLAVFSLILNAFFSVARQCDKKIITAVIAILAFTAVGIFGIDAILIIVLAIVFGIVYGRLESKKQ